MKNDEMDTLAAQYVLGTLDAKNRRGLKFRLLSDKTVQKSVADWENYLSPMAEALAPQQPPAGLWAKIEDSLDSAGPVFSDTIRAGDGEWIKIAKGVEKKQLFVDPIVRTQSYLLRLEPGATLESHDHGMVEECLMLEGEMQLGDLRLTVGDFHVVSPGMPHPNAISSATGALFYVRGEYHPAAG